MTRLHVLALASFLKGLLCLLARSIKNQKYQGIAAWTGVSRIWYFKDSYSQGGGTHLKSLSCLGVKKSIWVSKPLLSRSLKACWSQYSESFLSTFSHSCKTAKPHSTSTGCSKLCCKFLLSLLRKPLTFSSATLKEYLLQLANWN